MAAAIAIEGLEHHFGSGAMRKRVLCNIHLQVQPGESVLLTGPSGSGTTTLLTLIGALRHGELTLARREHGYIFQAHNLHRSLTARQNVGMALEVQGDLDPHEIDRRSCAMLAEVGLAEQLNSFPDQLSGGQKQRVAVARALVHRPPLVLADEPTAALDSQSGRDVVSQMQRLARDQRCTILLVTHDNRILDIADRILDMEDGQLQEASLLPDALKPPTD